MRDERTLTERLERVERILSISGFGGEECTAEKLEAAGQQRIPYPDKVEAHREQAGPSKTERVTSFEEIMNRIQGATDRICRQAGKIEEIGLRILGPLNQDEEGAHAVGVKPEGTLDHTFLALNWLDGSIARLEQAALRLERI